MTTTQSNHSPVHHWLQNKEHLESSKSEVLQPEVFTSVDLAHRVKQVQEWLGRGVESELHLTQISKDDLKALVLELEGKGIKLK